MADIETEDTNGNGAVDVLDCRQLVSVPVSGDAQRDGEFWEGMAPCSNGETLLGGSYRLTVYSPDFITELSVVQDSPTKDENAWRVRLHDPQRGVHEMKVFAVCARSADK